MMYSRVMLLVIVISGLFVSSSQEKLPSSPVLDLLLKTFIKTFETPITAIESEVKLSVDIMLDNDVFNLDDGLRLFIQQFIIALLNGNVHLIPDDWETRYPAYSRVIYEINQVLDLLGQRTLSNISMKDIRPLVKSLTPTAFIDLQRLKNAIEDKAKEEEEEETEAKHSSKEDL